MLLILKYMIRVVAFYALLGVPWIASCAHAQNSATSDNVVPLYIPGIDPSTPVSASVLGVDELGRTTWVLQRGTPEATTRAGSTSYPDFIGTATLVEGPNDASLTYANAQAQFTIGESCSFTESTLAVCRIVAQGGQAVTQTEIISHALVQVGGSSPGGISQGPSSTLGLPSTSTMNGVTSTSMLSFSSSGLPIISSTGTLPTSSSTPTSSHAVFHFNFQHQTFFGALALVLFGLLVDF
ncbi:hypothetical protein CPC08DRAFT_725273 [Agrocybe pediades]|nr:hypothetical protein CPC08DRAFT_725273 [Agrocybe pediades]